MSDSGPLFGRNPDAVNFPPFETEDLRENLVRFLDTPFEWSGGPPTLIGNFRWGVYAFFDYDGEPIGSVANLAGGGIPGIWTPVG